MAYDVFESRIFWLICTKPSFKQAIEIVFYSFSSISCYHAPIFPNLGTLFAIKDEPLAQVDALDRTHIKLWLRTSLLHPLLSYLEGNLSLGQLNIRWFRRF